MEIQEYLKQISEISRLFIDILDNSDDFSFRFQNFKNYYESQKKDPEFLKDILLTLSKICKNYHRPPDFYHKMEQILIYFKNDIKQSLSNLEIFKIFKKSEMILLILLDKKIISLNVPAFRSICLQVDLTKFCYFLNSYMLPFIRKKLVNINSYSMEEELLNLKIENYDEKRRKGENDSYICDLIRNDLIEEFVTHVNKNNIQLSSKINTSIFETSRFLAHKNLTLIQYAAFFGSIQIYQYLRLNGVNLDGSLWIYAIHGKNPDLIHLLEQDKIVPDDKSYLECLEEAIKCHHNDFAVYIQNNLIDQELKSKDDFNDNVIEYCFRYHNFSFLPENLDLTSAFHYSCIYSYLNLVKLLVKTTEIDINKKIIFIIFFL